MRPALAKVHAVLAAGGNPWRERLHAWGLLEVPYGLAARPSPARRQQLDGEHKQRIDAELARLQAHYGTKDAAATLARSQQDYDADTKKLEDSAKANELPPLVASVPMTLDDGLHYKTAEIEGVPAFAATFESMASARVQLSIKLNGRVSPDDGVYLAALPSLLSDAGVIVDGKPMPADEVRERLRKEVLELSVYFADNPRTGRVELVVAGAGNGAGETKTALEWMHRVLFSPDWRIDNLPRLRDLIDQQLTGSRQRMLGAEEGWVDDPRDAWRYQDPLAAHTGSFLTQMHDLHRLRWMLMDPRDAKVTDEAVKFVGSLGDASKLTRAQLGELAHSLATLDPKTRKPASARWFDAATKLGDPAKAIAKAAGKDLALILSDLPDGSLAADWRYLAKQMAADLKAGALPVLARLTELRAQIVEASAGRFVIVGSSATQAAIAPDIAKLAHALPARPPGKVFGTTGKPFAARLRERDATATKPLFVGLVAPGTSSGVFENTVTGTWYGNISDDAVLDYLACNLYTGHGGHSIFMKTWAAGLAYSNGLRPQIDSGLMIYYAERTPLLPQTLRFVIEQLRKAKPDAGIARYAVAEAFHSRIASGYEARASAMAANLVDGQTPDVVRTFRERVLAQAKQPDLAATLFGRMENVYGRVLPGYGKIDPDGTYFVIGPDKQLAAYEDYLHVTFGKDTHLFRLYPRDFWIPAKL
jgi:hypothetical protein